MASSVLSDTAVINWIKTGLAVNFTKDGLKEITEKEVTEFSKQIFGDVRQAQNISASTECNSCTTRSLLQGRRKQTCSSKLCDNIRDKITSAHRYQKPNWKNTDVSKWESSNWEIAKCFMPDGYCLKMSHEETDFNGIINILINLERFDNKMADDLSKTPNVLTEARQVGREFRHNERCKVNDTDFDDYIKKLSNVLKDPKYIVANEKAQNALKNVEQLCSDTWKISNDDIDTVLRQERVQEEINKEKLKMLEDIRSDLQHGRGELEQHIQRGIKRIRRESENQTKRFKQATVEDYVKRKDDLRHKLVSDLKANCKTISISPFLEEEETLLLSFYVVPIMQLREHHLVKEEYPVESYRDIFAKCRYRCKHIYITGEAGVGKTTMCQRMALLWALSHSTSRTSHKKYHDRDVKDMETMKNFDFLFFVNLRETSKCEVEEIIYFQLFRQAESDKEFLHKVLEREKCLIILDGLHEWSHAKSCQMFEKYNTPHSQIYEKCTFLTTSRHYRLESLRLKGSEIDREVVITGMDTNSQIAFIEHIANRLNKKVNIEDFFSDIEKYNMLDLLEVPNAAAHLVCLWMDNKLDNFSRSHLYGIILDNMFSLAINCQRTHHDPSIRERLRSPTQGKQLKNIPECITQLQHVQKHLSTLQKLFHLAFDSLFDVAGESVSYSNSDVVKYGLTTEDVDFLCLVGIFSKRKAIGFLTERKYKISFLHRCCQEYMAAVYIAMKKGDFRRVQLKITQACNTYVDVKRFANVFIVLATVDSELLERLFVHINKSISTDKSAKAFREYSCSTMYWFISNRRQQIEYDIQSLQDLVIKCREASHDAGSASVTMNIRDMFIFKNNIDQIAGLLTSGWNYIQSIFISEWSAELKDDLAKINTLQKMEVRYIDSEFNEITNLMLKSKSVLQNVFISYCEIEVDIPVKKLSNLRSVCLHQVKMLHKPLEELLGFLSRETRLSQIGLDEVRCLDHDGQCRFDCLNLSKHPEMHLLGLCDVSVGSISVDSRTLERLQLNCKNHDKSIWIEPFLPSLLNAPVLKKIVISCVKDQGLVRQLVKTIASLKSLRYVYLLDINFFDDKLELHKDIKQLEVELSHIEMSQQAFEHFLDSVEKCENKICVHLQFFRISSTTQPLKTDEVGKVIDKWKHFQINRLTDVSIKFRHAGCQSTS